MSAPSPTTALKPGAPDVKPHPLLTGQKALVTGANSGIGRGVAIALGQAGADVVVNYVVGDDTANAVVEQIRGFGVNSIALKADVSFEDEVDQYVPTHHQRTQHNRHLGQQCRFATRLEVSDDDVGAVEHGPQYQSHGTILVRA